MKKLRLEINFDLKAQTQLPELAKPPVIKRLWFMTVQQGGLNFKYIEISNNPRYHNCIRVIEGHRSNFSPAQPQVRLRKEVQGQRSTAKASYTAHCSQSPQIEIFLCKSLQWIMKITFSKFVYICKQIFVYTFCQIELSN